MIRNRVIADLATAVVVAHADPDSDSKVGALTCDLLAAGKPVYTFGHPANAAILDRGAKDVEHFDFMPFTIEQTKATT